MDETIYVIFKVQFDFALEVCFSIVPAVVCILTVTFQVVVGSLGIS